jgi:hypothetical protein
MPLPDRERTENLNFLRKWPCLGLERKKGRCEPAFHRHCRILSQYIRGHREGNDKLIELARLSSGEVACAHLAALVVADDVEVQLLTFGDGRHAGALNGRDVNEYVCAAIVRLNEAVTLGGVEPFYSTSSHDDYLSIA